MNSNSQKLLPALLATLLFLAGCGQSVPPVRYYSLVDTGGAWQRTENRYPDLQLSVGPVTVTDVLNKTPITTGGENGLYVRSDYHRWAGSFDRIFSRAVAEQLAIRLGTDQISLYPGPPYAKSGWQVILEVLTMEGDIGQEATLSVRWFLLNKESNSTVESRRSDFQQKDLEPGYGGWVRGQRQNIAELAQVISQSLEQHLK